MHSRREFLKLIGATVAALALPACKKDDEETVNPSMEKAHDAESYNDSVTRYITDYLDSNYPEYIKLKHRPNDPEPSNISNLLDWPDPPPVPEWPETVTEEEELVAVHYLNDGRVYVVSDAGSIYATNDMGETFHEVDWDTDFFAALDAVVPAIGWLSAEDMEEVEF